MIINPETPNLPEENEEGQIEKGSGYGPPNEGSGKTVAADDEEAAEAGKDYSGTGDYSGPINADED